MMEDGVMSWDNVGFVDADFERYLVVIFLS